MAVMDDVTDDMREQALKDSCNEYLECLLMCRADNNRHRGLMMTLDNANLFGNDDCPKTIKDSLHQLNNQKTPGVPGWKKQDGLVVTETNGVAFLQPRQQQ